MQYRTATQNQSYTTHSHCRHCDGEVVLHSTNGHLILITRLHLMSKSQAFLKAFYPMVYIDDSKRWLFD